MQIIEPLTEQTWGWNCVIFGEQKNKERMVNSFKNGEIFWMNNKAINEFGFRMKNFADLGGCYPPRPSASMDNTLLDLQNSSYLVHTKAEFNNC